MVKIYIDGKSFFVNASDNLLQACLSLGLDIPFFCWHPALGSIGSCRQCAIKVYRDKEDQVGLLVMSCMSEIKEGMRISIIDNDIKKFQKSIIELMMLNHPHDCPVCAEAGSCHLQDMTVLNKHHIRRYRFQKRIFKNQYLGPFVSHSMNRCITCYRCVRYYVDYSGGKDFGVYGANNNIYFGRLEEGMLESEYSGNLIDVCPTGVFTDKTNIQNFHRKWDLQYSPSICHHCSIGCNTSLGERLGSVCRIDNRYNKHINKFFLCDLGRFGYNYVNFNTVTKPFVRKKSKIKVLKYSDTISLVSKILKCSFHRILGIGSSRASVESNMALYKLVGEKNFSNGMLSTLDECMRVIVDIIKHSNIHIPSISEIEKYDVILIIGEDITQTASLAALSVRQAIQNGMYSFLSKKHNIPIWHVNAMKNIAHNISNSLFIVYGHETKLDDISKINYYGSIKQQVWFSNIILDKINENVFIDNKNDNQLFKKANFIAKTLCHAKKPLIISGTSYYNVDIIKIAFNIAQSLQNKGLPVGLSLFPPSVNSMGVSLIPGCSLNSMLDIIFSEKIDILFILENDLYRLYESKIIDNLFKQVTTVIVLDHQKNKTVQHADIFLPCTNFSESSGNVVNYEARLQRFFRTHDPNFYNKKIFKLEGWRWIHAIEHAIQSFSSIQKFTIDQMMKLCSLWNPFFIDLSNSSPSSLFKIKNQKIARSSIRCSGRTVLFANKNIHEPKTPVDVDSMFNFSMEGIQQIEKNFSFNSFLWSPNWNSNQSLYKSSLIFNDKINITYDGILLFKNYVKQEKITFFVKIPVITEKKNDVSFKVIPYYKLIGSEETSQDYFIKKTKINFFYVKLNYLDALKIQINEGDILKFQVNEICFKFPVQLSRKISLSHIGIPAGCNHFPTIFFNKLAINLIKYSK